MNVALLQGTLDYIKANPQGWDQRSWSTCFAARAAMLDGAVLVGMRDRVCGCGCDTTGAVKDGEPQFVGSYAQEALGLSDTQAGRLFCASNSLDDLTELVAEFIAEATPVPDDAATLAEALPVP